MHKFEMPKDYVERVTQRQGRAHVCDSFEPAKTALVVVDMQNYFMHPSQQSACPMAEKVVPNVNRLARATRAAGGKVVWIQNMTPEESRASWASLQERYLDEFRDRRMEAMKPEAFGYQLWPTLEIEPGDIRVTKRRYSAFIQGSSDIEIKLKDHAIDTVLITGVATNVCCESTARDAMMRNFRTLMVSDGCAAATDQEHAATLGAFYLFFGDVQTTDEVIARLEVARGRNERKAG